ncbi:SsgA family sporulation/cell division regulator [Kitasatospora phosalacinea]|uniref:SsgA family sporulation/cell division regulator n=1 Tax=Kitasatospora phosalacinea TaxID=2065 RepID=UPI0007C6EDE1|nr:SsgA family sporulation/cell division regulator [Kitasatospora phosalacinea]
MERGGVVGGWAVRAVRVRFPQSPASDLDVGAELRYACEDPFAVCLAFPAVGAPVEWYFCRNLLDAGRHRTTGLGDVTVFPGEDGTVVVALRGARGCTPVAVPADAVEAFLADAYALVPPGTEHLHLDVDTALTRLLAPPPCEGA